MKSNKLAEPPLFPWKLDDSKHQSENQVSVKIGEIGDDENCGWIDVHGARAKERAALIVCRVNQGPAFDAMKDSLWTVLFCLDNPIQYHLGKAQRDKVRAALKLAQAK